MNGVILQRKNIVTASVENDKDPQAVILVVDDSPTIIRLVTTALERQNYQAIAVTNGLEALAKMNEVNPDLILLDITMPHLDGYQVCKLIKGNQETKHIPVVMLSGKDVFFDKVKGRMVVASDYITKPFDPDVLLRTIAKHTYHQKR